MFHFQLQETLVRFHLTSRQTKGHLLALITENPDGVKYGLLQVFDQCHQYQTSSDSLHPPSASLAVSASHPRLPSWPQDGCPSSKPHTLTSASPQKREAFCSPESQACAFIESYWLSRLWPHPGNNHCGYVDWLT